MRLLLVVAACRPTRATGSSAGEPTGLAPRPPVPPHTVLVGSAPEEAFGFEVYDLGDTTGDGRREIGVSRLDGGPVTVYAWPLPVGTHAGRDVAVGVLPAFPARDYEVSPAGDANHDGFGDVWFGYTLYHGPLTGDRSGDPGAVRILGWTWAGVVGGFDADGDGWTDVALADDQGGLDVHYGPFTEDRPSRHAPGFDPSRATRVIGAEHGPWVTRYLGALNDPSEVVVTAGMGCVTGGCGGPIRAYDLRGPRGRVLSARDALAVFPGSRFVSAVRPFPDVDGDGLDDVLYLNAVAVTAPVSGRYPETIPGSAPGMRVYRCPGCDVVAPVEDLTGDGLGDLVVRGQGGREWYLLPGDTPGRDDAWLDLPSVGVPFGLPPDARVTLDRLRGVDLDGDALPEVIFWSATYGAGAVWIFRGDDLHAAYVAATAPLERRLD